MKIKINLIKAELKMINLIIILSFMLATNCTQNRNQIMSNAIKAHGGLKKWEGAPTVSWRREHIAYRGDQQIDHYYVKETVEQGSRKVYQEWKWPSFPNRNPIIVSNGIEIWSIDWSQPAPPKMVALFGYYISNLAWVSQDESVILSEAITVQGIFPDDNNEYYEVVMTFEGNDEKMSIYLDKESDRVKGCKFYFSDGTFLDKIGMPSNVKQLGPIYTKFDNFKSIDGLLMPSTYYAYDNEGKLAAKGTFTEWSFSKKFPMDKITKPKNAIVDHSSMERKTE